jgi:hypothetical protein
MMYRKSACVKARGEMHAIAAPGYREPIRGLRRAIGQRDEWESDFE